MKRKKRKVKRKTASLALTLQNTVCVLKFPCKLLFSGKNQVQYNGSLYIDLCYLHKLIQKPWCNQNIRFCFSLNSCFHRWLASCWWSKLSFRTCHISLTVELVSDAFSLLEILHLIKVCWRQGITQHLLAVNIIGPSLHRSHKWLTATCGLHRLSSRAMNWLIEELRKKAISPISSLLQYFIKSLSPVSWCPAAFLCMQHQFFIPELQTAVTCLPTGYKARSKNPFVYFY